MPAGSTYTPIATTTLGSSQANITFNSFSGYTDLLLVATSKMALYNGVNLNINVNGNTSAAYSWTSLRGDGSSASSTRQSNQTYMNADTYGLMDTSTFTQYNISFMNYSNSTTFKTMLSRANNSSRGTEAVVNLWRSTDAITSIVLDCGADSFATGSTFTLYGIAAA
jgi:hypothetical protein